MWCGFLRYVVSSLCVVVSTLCNVVSFFRIAVYFRCQVLLPRSPFFFKNPFIQFLLGPSAYSWNSKGEGRRERSLLSLLEKLHLGHLENFQRKKVTDLDGVY